LYDFLFVRPAKRLGYFLWKKGDGWLIDGFGPDGVAGRVLALTAQAKKLQTGYLYHYAFAMMLGVAGLITYFIASGAH
jgi:NADH-quinone oxidoreductase subunit L